MVSVRGKEVPRFSLHGTAGRRVVEAAGRRVVEAAARRADGAALGRPGGGGVRPIGLVCSGRWIFDLCCWACSVTWAFRYSSKIWSKRNHHYFSF